MKKTAKKKSKKTSVKKTLKTYIALILDCSGSMESIRAETISHFNEQIEQIQMDSKGLDTYVSLVTFNHNVEFKCFNENIDTIKPLTLKSYTPGGNTAMLDGIGLTIDRLEKEVKDIASKNTAVLIVTLSDGQENASKLYNTVSLAEKIQRLQETKRWTFTYIGANQDLSVINQQLHIPLGNIQAFTADAAGMNNATTGSVGGINRYMTSRRVGTTQSQSYYIDPNGKP